MADLTVEDYERQHADCDGLCDIDHDRKPAVDNPFVMPCVTCPFCKELVDAELTPTTIACPACKVAVSR